MLNFRNIIELVEHFKTETECIAYLKDKRKLKGLECPYCWSSKIYEPKNEARFRCGSCKAKFSVKQGTIFEGSNVPLKKWFMACYLLMAHKKGISSNQLAKDISVTQKTAWFMLQRLRHATSTESFKKSFKGVCEVDEAYLGGAETNRHMKERIKGVKEKAVVVGIVNRDEKQLLLQHTNSSKYYDLAKPVVDNIEAGAVVVTDESTSYKLLKTFFNHQTINHSKGEYVRKEKNASRVAYKITTNTVEGVFGLLKRGIDGIYHWVSKKHLQKYLNEFSFRYNTRSMKDYNRFDFFCDNLDGRLKYKYLIAKV